MLDFYDIDSVLSEEERAVRDSVRRFVDERVLPIIGDAYVQGRFPRELIPELGELGVFGANLPEEYGCAGLNNVQYGLIMQELERGDSGSTSISLAESPASMDCRRVATSAEAISPATCPPAPSATAHRPRSGRLT